MARCMSGTVLIPNGLKRVFYSVADTFSDSEETSGIPGKPPLLPKTKARGALRELASRLDVQDAVEAFLDRGVLLVAGPQ